MSKVIHLSDDAHNTAKGFCKQHGLKMSDWVAALIAEAIAHGRTNPSQSRLSPPAPVAHAHAAPQVAVAVAPPAHVAAPPAVMPPSPNSPPKKKLARFREDGAVANDGTPPWASPPFWSGSKSQTK